MSKRVRSTIATVDVNITGYEDVKRIKVNQ